MSGSQYNSYFDQPVYGAVVGEHNTVTINISHLSPSPPPFTFRSIIGITPPTDSRTIQQRASLVETIYSRLNESGLNALVLTGIGGVGKSTLAALVYRYVEVHHNTGPFTVPPLWLTIDPSATFADIIGTICQALDKPLPSLNSLSLANQALALFNTLATTKSSRLIVLDQFENFLDWNTGAALPDHQEVGEWLNALNSQPFQTGCRLLLTSRPRPKGTREYQPLCLRECPVDGLTTAEGLDFLHKQGVQAPEAELHKMVDDCNGHALSLTLLVALLQDYQMPLTDLLVDPARWEGDIATHLLNTIFMRLDDTQRNLFRAFSVYQIPVSIEVVLSQIEPVEQKQAFQEQAFQALRVLLAQHLIQAVGEGRYQPHIIVANYVKRHFVEGDEQANQRAVQQAQEKADQYQKQYQNHQRFLARVRAIWIKGVLEQSLHGAALIPLGERRKIHANPWRLTLQQGGQAERTLPGGTRITQVYDEALGELLILGERGSGKTTLLLELLRDLLDRAQTSENAPIPVVFNLSSWAKKRLALSDWLVEEVSIRYDVPRRLGQSWVSEDRLLLLLDGLDEVASAARKDCIEAINSYRQTHPDVQIVVCSRSTEYLNEPTQLRLHTAVVVQPLTQEQIDAYLESAGEQAEALREALRQDADLRELATTPLMLTILLFAYRGTSPDKISELTSLEAKREQIFTSYVQHILQRRSIKSDYTAQQTIHWLTWLAKQMILRNQTEFYIERLQPDWLQDRRLHLAYRAVVMLIVALIGGVVFGLVGGVVGLADGVVFGLLSGLYLERIRDIRPSEVITWSWKRILSKLNYLLLWVAVFGLVIGLGAGFVGGLLTGLGTGLIGAFGIGLLYILLIGFSSETLERHRSVRPNQGIWRSARTGMFIGLNAGLVGMLLGGSIGNLFVELLRGSAIGGLALGLLGWFIFGGYAFIQHFVLRFLLWRVKSIPWNYPHFLDYATERILLRKVGGGYIFVHRLLLEYFAWLDETNK